MQKQIRIDVEREVKEELQRASGPSEHQMVPGNNGQFVDAHFNMTDYPLTNVEIGRGQIESLLALQTDSDTLRLIENAEDENRILSRIKWGRKG